MTAFRFDPKASLERAQEPRTLPTFPTSPTKTALRGQNVGTVGNVGRVADAEKKTPHTADALADALDHFEERAAIREHDGGQTRAEAEAAAMLEAAEAYGIPADELRDALTKRRPPDPDTNENPQGAAKGD